MFFDEMVTQCDLLIFNRWYLFILIFQCIPSKNEKNKKTTETHNWFLIVIGWQIKEILDIGPRTTNHPNFFLKTLSMTTLADTCKNMLILDMKSQHVKLILWFKTWKHEYLKSMTFLLYKKILKLGLKFQKSLFI